MRNNALTILKTFTDEDLIAFEKFLHSPYHNTSNKVILFFNLLKKFHPEYASQALTAENLFRDIYGEEKFVESYIRNLFSDLKILAESFLLHDNLEKSTGKSKMLIEELHKRDVTPLLIKKVEAFDKELDKRKIRDQDFFNNKLFIYEIKSFLEIDNKLSSDFRKDQMSSLLKLFMIYLMENSFHMLVEEQRIKIRHDYSFLKYVLDYLKSRIEEFDDSPLLMIFYFLWMGFLEDNSEVHFTRARAIFKQNFEALSQIDKKNIYAIMQTYYDNKINEGEGKYNYHLMDLLLEMLEYKVISHNRKNSINLNLYRNVLILSYKLNEKEKMKNFISEYLKFVRSESRRSIGAYSNAHLAFLEGRFEDALMFCNKVDFNDLFTTTNENLYFKLDIKSLTLKCLYELNSIENALSHLQTFRQFLKNSKIIKESSKNKFLNLIKSVNDLLSLRNNFDEYKYDTLKKEIRSSGDRHSVDWLELKLKEFKVKKK